MKNFSPKLLIKMLVLGMSWTLIYALGFIQYLLYDPFQQTLGCTNAQLGILMTIFGIGNVLGAPIGGWLADRFDYKKIFVASLVGNGILSLIFAFNMTYGMAVWIWVGLAVTTLVMNYPSHIKIIRMMADEKNQGKIFGLNESFVGVGSIILNAIFLGLFATTAVVAVGMKYVVIAIGIASLICAVLAWLVTRGLEESEKEDMEKNEEKMGVKDFVAVIKSPATWLQGLAIFSIYTCAVTMSYFTPYATSVLGMTVAFSGGLSIVRTYGLRLVGAPLGGVLSDKIGSTSKSLIIIYGLGILTMVAFLVMPAGVTPVLVIALILLVGCVVYMGKGIYYAVSAELQVPRKYAATTVGVAAALGFSPDIFLFPLIGYWLDTYGNDGYRYVFIFQAVVMAIGILGSLYALSYKKKLLARNPAV
ncbi:MAG: MFS transporter [Oscillospiraceae bacterium]